MDDDEIPIETARSARDAALRPGALARASRSGELSRLRRGAYAASSEIHDLDEADRHRLLVRAARLAARSEPVFSHESAAALHELPIIGEWPESVIVTGEFGGRRGPVRRVRRGLADDELVVGTDGTRLTSLARTAVDVAAHRSLLGGIVAMSHARAHDVSPGEIEIVLARIGPITGIRRARLALSRSTTGSESVLETLVVVRCQDEGFETPEQQRVVRGVDGRPYRVDFAWREGRVLAEADGRAKYLDARLRGERSIEEVLLAEKRREDALRPVCDRFIRFDWNDAWDGLGLVRRLEAAGVPRPFRRRSRPTF